MKKETKIVNDAAIYVTTIDFAYSQFQVFDISVKLPGCAWTEGHYKQGFARREPSVNFRTMLEFGRGDVAVYLSPYNRKNHHQRVIEVPIEVSSGKVVIGGPEEYPERHIVQMPKGSYRLVAAQTVTADDCETIELYFEQVAEPLANSRILLADDELDVALPLLENAEVA